VFDVDLRGPVIAAQRAVPHMIRQGGGAIVNVSSAAALNYYPGQMAYGMAKAALEHLTVSLAVQLRPHSIPVNTLRIDVPVASEGFLAAMPGVDHSDWEPPVVAAEGILWMLRQGPDYTGHNVGMARLRAEHGIMPSRAERPHTQAAGMVTDSPLGA
jgi:NAD(P)-dependent dehydrogenase (short-subunit alcohol dehydrogenase family)